MKKGNQNLIKQRLGDYKQRTNKGNFTGTVNRNADARLKLIQKKREGITDARDRLAQIARQTDARVKLMKNKQNGAPVRVFNVSNGQNMNQNRPGRKFSGNKIVLSNNSRPQAKFVVRTSKVPPLTRTLKFQGQKVTTGMKGATLKRTIKGGVARGIPAIKMGMSSYKPIANRYYPIARNPHVVTIKNKTSPQVKSLRKPISITKPSTSTAIQKKAVPASAFKINKAVISSPSILNSQLRDKPDGKGSVWYPGKKSANNLQEQMRSTKLKITTKNDYMANNNPHQRPPQQRQWNSYSQMDQGSRRHYDEDQFDEYVPSRPKSMAPAILSRLDQSINRPMSPGFKLFVSNLHHVVSPDDVEELFQTIGPLLASRMLRPGAAEVVFVNQKDAYRAMEVYHNRQLDGQPMNVSIADDYPSFDRQPFRNSHNSMSSGMNFNPQFMGIENQMAKSSHRFHGGGNNSSMRNNEFLSMIHRQNQKHNNVAPDINAIHHALFNQRPSQPMSSHMNPHTNYSRHSLRRN